MFTKPINFNWPKIKEFLKIFLLATSLILAFLLIYDIIVTDFAPIKDQETTDETSMVDTAATDELEEESDCNVVGVNLHGGLVTYLPPDAFDSNGDLAEDISASEHITPYLIGAEENDKIKAFIMEVDSSGGSPVAGLELANALKSAKKPTIAFIRGTGASSAYLAATGADTIFASSYSDVGSIGVTMSYLENYKQNQKEGLEYVSLSSGKFKDSGNPDKPITQEEKNLFMRDILKLHDLFVKEVAKNRKLPLEKVKKLADGSSMLGEDALKNGLIDKLGEFEAVNNYLKELIGEEPNICWN